MNVEPWPGPGDEPRSGRPSSRPAPARWSGRRRPRPAPAPATCPPGRTARRRAAGAPARSRCRCPTPRIGRARPRPRREPRSAGRRRVAQGVRHQVRQHLDRALRVGLDLRQARRQVHGQAQAALGYVGLQPLDGRPDDGRRLDRAADDRQLVASAREAPGDPRSADANGRPRRGASPRRGRMARSRRRAALPGTPPTWRSASASRGRRRRSAPGDGARRARRRRPSH